MASLKLKIGSRQQIVSVQTTDLNAMNLADLRKALGATMLDSDRFMTKDNFEIDKAQEDDKEFTVGFVMSDSVVAIKRSDSGGGGVKTIKIKKGLNERSQDVDVGKSLADLRTLLGAWVAAGDRFMVGGAPFEGAEADKKIEEAIVAGAVEIKLAAAGTVTFDVAMGSETTAQKKSVTIDPKKSLSDLRTLLGSWMAAKAKFLTASGGEVTDEASTTIASVLGDAKKLVVKKAPGFSPGETPDVPVVDPPGGLDIGWGLGEGSDVNFDNQAYAKLIESLTIKAGATSEAIKWDDLPKGEKQALFRQLQLNHTIRMPAAIVDGQDLRCFRKAIVVANEPRYLNPQNERRDTNAYTFSKQVEQLRRRGITSAHSSFAGFGVAVSANLTHDKETYSRQQQQVMYFEAGSIVDKVKIMIDTVEEPGSVQASKAFAAAVTGALAKSDAVQQYLELLNALDQYGHYLATEFVIGGKVTRTAEQGVTASSNAEQLSIQFGAEVAADLQTSKGPVKFGAGGGHSNSNNTSTDQQQQWAKSDSVVIGGDPARDYSGWLVSLGSPKRWNVTEYSQLKPTLQFLPNDIRSKCVALILKHANHPDTKTRTALDMRDYIAPLVAQATEEFG